eukprot:Hpha_TRINITY_DN15262_c1_g12::TRINITY_DN15262_c1_g12_i1::g.64303::m.64303
MQGKVEVEAGGLVFSSKFDSGNLARVEVCENGGGNEFSLWTSADCEGTPYENSNRSWFHFRVSGGTVGRQVTFHIRNLNSQQKLFAQDMRPVFCRGLNPTQWERIENRPQMRVASGQSVMLSFYHSFISEGETVWFAFTYPYSFTQLQQNIGVWAQAAQPTSATASNGIYFVRECMGQTLEGRRVDLLTITGEQGKSAEREAPIDAMMPVPDPQVPRPHQFPGKKIVMLTARVHPGESAASYCIDGVIQLLLARDDPRGAALRENFVFKIIPMLNPDGVVRGHYRTDTLGVNLNRVYETPCDTLHPTICAARRLFLSLHHTERLTAYIDFHAHATKRGCFIYGNALEFERQVENLIYPKLISLNTPHFDFSSCNFTERNMRSRNKRDGLSKEGTGRVAMFNESGLTHCYTLECNYNTGLTSNAIQALQVPRELPPPSTKDRMRVPKYTPAIYRDVGKAAAVALLDYHSCNPISRLPTTPYNSAEGVRQWVMKSLKVAMTAEAVAAKRIAKGAAVAAAAAMNVPIGGREIRRRAGSGALAVHLPHLTVAKKGCEGRTVETFVSEAEGSGSECSDNSAPPARRSGGARQATNRGEAVCPAATRGGQKAGGEARRLSAPVRAAAAAAAAAAGPRRRAASVDGSTSESDRHASGCVPSRPTRSPTHGRYGTRPPPPGGPGAAPAWRSSLRPQHSGTSAGAAKCRPGDAQEARHTAARAGRGE